MERFGISVGSQLLEAVRFAGVGILLGVLYDLFRLSRLLGRPSAWRIFFQDLLFFALAAAVTLTLSLPISSGRIRIFHLLALTVGFVCYYETVGRLIYAVARWLTHVAGRLHAWENRLAHRLRASLKCRLPFVRENWAKKGLKKLKNRLKPAGKI